MDICFEQHSHLTKHPLIQNKRHVPHVMTRIRFLKESPQNRKDNVLFLMPGQINHVDHDIQDETRGGNTHPEELKEGFKKRKGNSYICIY